MVAFTSSTSTSPHVFVLLLLIHAHLLPVSYGKADRSSASAFFVFGDSSADTGNNNYIPTTFRSNFPPYGRDFAHHRATGRFANGKVGVDYLASKLGLKETIPPYLDPTLTEHELLTGVNFASAGSGFDPLTSELSGVIPVRGQLEYMEEYISKIGKIAGKKKAAKIIQESVALIIAGANDFIVNYYFLPVRMMRFSEEQYQDFLLDQLSHILNRLRDLGIRRMVVTGLPPMGCLPAEITLRGNGVQQGCIDGLNWAAEQYNSKLQSMLGNMSRAGQLRGAKIAYGDIYSGFLDLVQNPTRFGFQESRRGCCGSGLLETGPSCNSMSSVCPDASPYVFWDAIHCTSKAAELLSDNLFHVFLQVL